MLGLLQHLVIAVADDHFAVVAPGLAGDAGRRKDVQQALHLGQGGACQALRVGDEDGGRCRPVLGLTEQVRRTQLGIDGLIGDDERLGRAGKQIDADAAEQLPLGLGDEGIAGPHQHVHRCNGLRAERHGGNRLDAAKAIDLVGATHVHGCDDGRMRRAALGRRRGDDALHTGDFRGDDAHMGRGHHGVFAAGHIAADRAHRDVFVTEHDTGQRLHLDVAERCLLVLGEAAHLRLGKADVCQVLARDLLHGRFDLPLAQTERGRVVRVELPRQIPDRRIAPRRDRGEQILDGRANLGVVLGPLAFSPGCLEMADHRVLRWVIRHRAAGSRHGASVSRQRAAVWPSQVHMQSDPLWRRDVPRSYPMPAACLPMPNAS